MLSNQQRGTTAWLRAVPTASSLRLAPAEFRVGLRLFCGLLPHGVPASLQCKCGKELSVPHVLACRKLRARIMRHDAIVDDLLAWLRTDRGVSVFKEVMHIGKMDGNQLIDLLVRRGGIAYWGDVSVSEP